MKRFLLLIPACLIFNSGSAQNLSLHFNDSLKGFDEAPIIQDALSKGVGPEELSLHVAAQRRNYIKQKYNLNAPLIDPYYIAKTTVAACINEDFEEASILNPVPGTVNVTTTNAINGWGAFGSSNSSGGATGNCTNPYTYGLPNTIQLIAPGAAGLTDAIIGPGYKIYSVFGNTTTSYPAAAAQDPFNHYGDWIAKINNSVAGAGVNRLTKTINVTPSNVYFNFAAIVVVQGAHCCCDGGAINISFKDCLGNFLATTQQYSIAAPAGAACTPSGNCATSSSITIYTSTASAGWSYSKWANSSIDLSPWLGQCVTAEFTAFDCTYSGHAGYAYVDAQCAPVVVNGINSVSNKVYYKLYPNPNSGNFNIDIAKEINDGEIEMRNILGQVVHRQYVKQGNNQIQTENLAKGLYNYSVLQSKEIVSVGKVVIE